jgi:16S rRNA (cytosine967-C5)-methyltransferase
MTGRDYALFLLDSKHLPGWPAGSLRRGKREAPADSRDLALAEQIAVGVTKNLLLLQHHIEHYSGKPPAQIDPLVRKILAIGLYQLEFLDRVPASAAVDEAVKQAKRVGRARAAGMVNAVLRNATRRPPPPLPDPRIDPRGFAQVALSHPAKLYTELAELLGADRALEMCKHNNAQPPTLVRLFAGVNAGMLAAPGVEIVPHQRSGMLVVQGARQELLGRWARQGLAQPQDATAAAVVDFLNLGPGQIVLDRCAGLGTKTLQIQERIGAGGRVVAVDSSSARCQGLRRLLSERRIDNVTVFETGDMSGIANEIGTRFDRILIDAPCSNSGVLARRPEAKYSWQRHCLVMVQKRILHDTADHLSAGGRMVYSTCSIWPAENERQIEDFLAGHPRFKLVEQHTTLPSFQTADPAQYHDGGYVAVLEIAGDC